jgi:hypothetical protein
MQLARSGIALDPRRFGRGMARTSALPMPPSGLSGDVKLFLTTFAAGFLFVSVLLA